MNIMEVLKEIILFENEEHKGIFKVVHNKNISSQEFFEMHYEVISNANEVIERCFIVLTKERFFDLTNWMIGHFELRE